MVYRGVQVTLESASGIKVEFQALVKGVVTPFQGWVGKSIIHGDSEAHKMGTSGTLVIPLWVAEKNKWPT